MAEAFICDAVRTPIGRYAGRARQGPHRRPRRRAAQGPDGAQSQGRLVEARRGLFRLRQPGRRGQPQRRPHGAAAGGPARQRAGRDAEPAVRLGAQCGRRGRAGDPRGRHRFRHRGRRRVDDARAVRAGQGDRGVLARGRDLRHHHRLALHQSADEEAVRRRRDAGDRRERRGGIPGEARRPGRLRVALAAARRQGDRGGLLRRGDRAGGDRRQGAGEGRGRTSIRVPTRRSKASPS